MILSNVEILRGIEGGSFNIHPLAGKDPTKPPFNTSAVDLRLNDQISQYTDNPAVFDLRKPGAARLLQAISTTSKITDSQPFHLSPGKFILAQTIEHVDFPLNHRDGRCYSARVEGKSSLARCGLIVHFTAPTIHAGFAGPITLEIINLGPMGILLSPGQFICQLIIEEVAGTPTNAPNQFKGQVTPAGTTG